MESVAIEITGFWMFYFAVVGACIGSFLNVVIYRVPEGLSIVNPGSHCYSCNRPIKPWNNIPILSYFILGGKCGECGASYSSRYMLIEVLTAFLFVACYAKFGKTIPAVIMMALIASLVAVTFIDIDHFIIPDVISLPGIPIGLLCSWLFLPTTITDAFSGFMVGGGLFLLLATLVPHGMGGGDIKLVAMLGTFLGLKGVFITIFLGSIVGIIGGVAGIIFAGKGRKSKIPFGPYLVIGALAAIFYTQELTDFYIHYFIR